MRRQNHLREQVEALSASISAAEALFIAGRVTYLDIITAQKGMVAAEISEVDVNKESVLNQIVLYKALGGGWQ